jgi:hypothetical protein
MVKSNADIVQDFFQPMYCIGFRLSAFAPSFHLMVVVSAAILC